MDMIARRLALLTTAAVLALPALPSTASAEPVWDCTDAPFRLVPFTCFAYNTADDNVPGGLPQKP